MNLTALVASLSDEEKQELLEIISSTNEDVIKIKNEPLNTHPPFIDDSSLQHEEPISKTVDGDFTMNKNANSEKKRAKVQARENEWVDTGEAKDVETPKVTRTPRNRSVPKKKNVNCHACGKTFQISPSLMFGEYYRCDRCSGNS